jgi:hypothetical protein
VKDEDIDLKSVNWEHGMFVTPDHMLRQERYIDSAFAWLLRNCTDVYGLIGGGPRVEPAERGAAKYDPIVDIYEDDELIRVTVSQCRGVSPSGDLIEIDPPHAVHVSQPKGQLEGVRELGVYVTCRPHDKFVEEEFTDSANPQMRSSRRRRYVVKLDVSAEEAGHSLLLARLARAERGLRFERQAGFIPPCATLAGCSELLSAWRQMAEQVSLLADRYTELHRAIGEYMNLAVERGIETREDSETVSFAGRMVAALEDCAYQVLDPLQSPSRFFQQLYRLIRGAAIYLDLSPATRNYFSILAEKGETEFVPLLEQERQVLAMARQWAMHADLGQEVRRVQAGLHRLQHLEQALEGKYIDFRVSRTLESLNFFFDRSNDALYQSLSRPTRPHVLGQELTFVFARLELKLREEYRLVLIGEPEARFEIGDPLSATIRINPAGGQSSKPIHRKGVCEIFGQRNFAIDFDAPVEIGVISDLRVTVNVTRPVQGGILYVRRRFYKSEPATPVLAPREPLVADEPKPQPWDRPFDRDPESPPSPPGGKKRRLIQD